MMKIALIYPNKQTSEPQMSLGIGYLASFVLSRNNDVDVRVLDTGVSTQKELNEFLRQRYDAVGVTVTSRTYNEGIEIANKLRQSQANVPIIFGGPHVSIMMQEIMKDSVIDLAVYGEGELTFSDIISLLRTRKAISNVEVLSKIEGLIFRSSNGVVVSSPRALISDLDALPFPAFHLFPINRYVGKLPMITSRGCPFACVFCASSHIWGRKWRARSPKNIIEEVKYLTRKFGFVPIDFHDDSFNIDLKRVNAICDEFLISKIRIPWGVRGFRADMVNDQVALKMRRAGCTHVTIGIESANQQMLKRMGKRETKEQIAAGINILRSAGIDVFGQFMIGNPGETLETVKESIEFVQTSGLIKASFGTAVPFPKTGLWEYVKAHGRFLVEEDCTRFEDMNPRIIFETPEFNSQQRLQAIRMAEQAGFRVAGGTLEEKKSFLQALRKRIIFRYLFKILTASISVRVYFFLRKIRAELHR